MAQAPYPMADVQNVQEAMRSMQMSMDDLYQNRLGGALLGDVFTEDSEDVLTISVGDGLKKTNKKILAFGNPSGGIVVTSAGIAVLLAAGGGLSVNASGISVSSTFQVGFGVPTLSSLIAGVLTVSGTNKHHSYAVDGGVGSADLTSIVGSALQVGDLLLLRSQTVGNTVVVKKSATILLQLDFSLDSPNDRLLLVCDDASSYIWSEVSRANNG